MKHYVAGFMKDRKDRVALVRKNKPTWQAGRLNGIGGGIEPGETPIDAMRREWHEETGLWLAGWIRFAEIRFPETIVHFFKTEVVSLPEFPKFNDIGEKLEVWDLSIVVRSDSVLPNLKWLLPMAFEDPDAKFALLTPVQHALPAAWPVAANDNDHVGKGEVLLPVAA